MEEALNQALVPSISTEWKLPIVMGLHRTVKSIQRIDNPGAFSAAWVTEEYLRWLPQALGPFIHVVLDGDRCDFKLYNKITLLKLEWDDKNLQHMQVLHVKGGLLAKKGVAQGRLEFVEITKQTIIAALLDYTPSLPWIFYRFSQALVHLWVMRRFTCHLRLQNLSPKT